MKKYLLLTAIALLAFGCSQKKVYVHDPLKNELLAYTQKFEDTNDKFLVVGTYLNPIHQDIITQNNEENFILSIYPKDTKIDFTSFKINDDNNETKISVLSDDDPLLKLTTFKMPWGMYLKISAPQKQSDTLKLSFERLDETSHHLQVSLSFQKIAKSLYWNSKSPNK
ncbi:hypothetical protein [Campylobacter iguaniorum]|uniref:hypothetical protein n=1 Tax=Campylobacter iguaniorum TaxID=1244531 RepID=UPI0009ED1EC7|nr:hypothetical protein [Campylobacter iguaniorum]